jgi:hypothetical protein
MMVEPQLHMPGVAPPVHMLELTLPLPQVHPHPYEQAENEELEYSSLVEKPVMPDSASQDLQAATSVSGEKPAQPSSFELAEHEERTYSTKEGEVHAKDVLLRNKFHGHFVEKIKPSVVQPVYPYPHEQAENEERGYSVEGEAHFEESVMPLSTEVQIRLRALGYEQKEIGRMAPWQAVHVLHEQILHPAVWDHLGLSSWRECDETMNDSFSVKVNIES